MSSLTVRASVLFAALLALAACNTIGGVGEDLQSGGSAIEEEAEEASD